MAERSDTPSAAESKKENEDSPQTWLDRIKEYQREFKKWEDQRKNIDSLYSKKERADVADREYSIFWANLEVLKPSSYARPPVPVVAPRFKDSNRLASVAAETLERSLVVTFEQGDIDGLMQEVRDDFLMYGRGQARVRLIDDEGKPRLSFDHFMPGDFAHDLKPSWRMVEWSGPRAWITRDHGIARFGEKFREVPLRKKDQNAVTPDKEDTAPVWEIWCKKTRHAYWLAEDFPEFLDKQPVYHDLERFFPWPKPAYGTLIPGSLVPVPEIRQYKDQIEEINQYTARIAALSEALRVRGFYPAGAGDISEAIEAAVKSTDDRAMLIPVSAFAAMGGAGLDKSVVWWPIDQVVSTVKILVELRRVVIDDVYQITGISDIVRGSAEAGGAKKTATEQQLKSQWGSMRIQERQKELVRFARDMTRISGEIIAEEFDPQAVVQMAQLQAPTREMKAQAQQLVKSAQAAQQPVPPDVEAVLDKPAMEDIFEFLKNDRARGFIIEIETDSTIQPDEDAEKQRRIEFATAVGGLMKEAVPMVMTAPILAPAVGAVLKFVAQGFRASRPLEAEIDKLEQILQNLSKQAQQAPPKPDPEIEKVKQQGEIEKAKLQSDMQAKQLELQLKDKEIMLQDQREREKMAREEQLRAMEMQQQAAEGEANRQAAAKEARSGRDFEAAKAGGILKEDIDERLADLGGRMEQGSTSFAQALDKIAMDMQGGFQQAAQQRQQDVQSIQGVLNKVGSDMQGIARQVADNQKAIRAVSSEVGNLKKTVGGLAKQVAALDEDAKAPLEITRDKDGRPDGFKKGRRAGKFARDKEDRIAGAQ